MLLLVEDKRFSAHWGIDLLAIVRAAFADIAAGRLAEGGSTLTQQLFDVRGVRSTRRDRSWLRKVQQVIWAMRQEQRMSKTSILREYLDSVYWGQDIFGLPEAARRYCNVKPADLNPAQSFFLAERIASPNAYYPGRVTELLRRPPIAVLLDDESLMQQVRDLYVRHFSERPVDAG